MENFTAIYVYADGVTLSIGFPGTGVTIYELHKTSAGAQTFYTQVLHANRKGDVEITFDQGVYGWHVDTNVAVTVSTHPDVTVSTRAKPSKDPWPQPPPPPPPTKFGALSSPQWNLHYKSLALRENEFMYSLGGAGPDPGERSSEPDPDRGGTGRGTLSMIGVHVAATRRGPAYGPTVAAGELTFPTDMMAIGHRLTHLRGAEYSQFLLGETATRDNVIEAVLSASRRLAPHGVFVLSFAGHGGQMPDLTWTELDGADEVWQLYDAFLYDDELGFLLSCFHPSVHCVVIADCCNAGGIIDHDAERHQLVHHWGGLNAPAARPILPRHPLGAYSPLELRRRVPAASTALIAATGEQQVKVNTPQTLFGRTLEHLLSSGRAPTYRALEHLFQHETPASERANVWCSTQPTWDMPPMGR